MNGKLGKAGRFYSLTPKAHKFIEALEKWCAERGIKPEEIPKFLEGVVARSRDMDWEMMSWNQRYKDLVDKGYLVQDSGVTQA